MAPDPFSHDNGCERLPARIDVFHIRSPLRQEFRTVLASAIFLHPIQASLIAKTKERNKAKAHCISPMPVRVVLSTRGEKPCTYFADLFSALAQFVTTMMGEIGDSALCVLIRNRCPSREGT